MLNIPLKRVQELEGDQKTMIINMIRLLCREFANETHLGLEKSEEALTELINKGYVKIIWDKEKGIFYLTNYNFETESYVIKPEIEG